jgi:hypothetical protein
LLKLSVSQVAVAVGSDLGQPDIEMSVAGGEKRGESSVARDCGRLLGTCEIGQSQHPRLGQRIEPHLARRAA